MTVVRCKADFGGRFKEKTSERDCTGRRYALLSRSIPAGGWTMSPTILSDHSIPFNRKPSLLFFLLFYSSQAKSICCVSRRASRRRESKKRNFISVFISAEKLSRFTYATTHIRKQFHFSLATRVHILFCVCVFFFLYNFVFDPFFPSHKQKRVYRHRSLAGHRRLLSSVTSPGQKSSLRPDIVR